MTAWISSARSADRDVAGFALFEVVLALAVIALLAAVILPRLGPGTGTATLRAKAYSVAALLRDDRNAAIWHRKQVVTSLDLARRRVISGATGRWVRVPKDIRINLVQSRREQNSDGGGFRFYADGRSSGGVVTLSRGRIGYAVRVNWLSAAVTVRRESVVR